MSSYTAIEADKLGQLCMAVIKRIYARRNEMKKACTEEYTNRHNARKWYDRWFEPYEYYRPKAKRVTVEEMSAHLAKYSSFRPGHPWYEANEYAEKAMAVAHRLQTCALLGQAINVDAGDLEKLIVFAPCELVNQLFHTNPYHRQAG